MSRSANCLAGFNRRSPAELRSGLQAPDAELLRKIEKELEAGYQRIKLKIKPGRDYDMVKTVRKEFPEITLTVDADSAYTLNDVETFKRWMISI